MKSLSPIEYSENLINNEKVKMPKLLAITGHTDMYGYGKTHYNLLTDVEVDQYIYNHFLTEGITPCWSINNQKSIKQALLLHPQTKKVPKLDSHPDHINVRNGIIDLTTPYPHKLIPHSDEFRFTSIVDVDYDPEAEDVTNFMDFLGTSLTLPDMVPDTNTITTILMMMGYIIVPQQRMEGLFIFLGDGSNGKSLLIDIISSFFPKQFISYLSLSDIAKNNKERDQLMTSRLNISGEEKGNPIDSSEIKKISSGQHITIQRMHKPPISWQPNTKLIVDSNTIPQFKDSTHGTLRRLNIFKFHNRAVPEAEYNQSDNPKKERLILRKNRDTFFPEIMKEKSAILNLILRHYKQLQDLDYVLPRTETSKETFDEYRETTDTLGYWLEQNYTYSDTKMVKVVNILSDFREFYDENFPGQRCGYSTKAIGMKIKQIFRDDGVLENYTTNNGKRSTTTAYHLKKKVLTAHSSIEEMEEIEASNMTAEEFNQELGLIHSDE